MNQAAHNAAMLAWTLLCALALVITAVIEIAG